MAEDSNQRILEWTLEYVCYKMHNEFIRSLTVDSISNRQFINGLFRYLKDGKALAPNKQCLMKYIQLLMHLADGADQATTCQELTPLQNALNVIDEIQQHYEEHEMADVFSKFKRLIRSQAVLVCCRSNNFEKARDLIKTLFHDDNETEDHADLLEVVSSGRRTHVLLRKSTFVDFLKESHKFLTEIFSTFGKPFMIMADEKFHEIHSKEIKALNESNTSRKRKTNKRKTLYKDRMMCKTISAEEDTKETDDLVQREEGRDSASSSVENIFSEESNATLLTESPRHKKSSSSSSKRQRLRLKRPIISYSDEDGDKIEWSSDEDGATISGPKLKVRHTVHTKKKRRPWSEEEVAALRRGVSKHGIGNWAKIVLDPALAYRTSVNLKDKWRNLTINSLV